MREWTKQQRAAIDLRGDEIYVAAAAGSGKTSVLVERVISLISDRIHPADPERMLVVTFTNAAAAEMTARVRARLDGLLQKYPGDGFLTEQARRARRMRIGTVHAFCNTLLKEFWNELGIPPDFTVADDLFAESLRASAMQKTMEELYADEASGITAFGDLFGRAREDGGTEEAIALLHRFLSDLADPAGWKRGFLLSLADGLPAERSPEGRYLLLTASEAVAAGISALKSALSDCAEDETAAANYAAALQSDLDTFCRIARELDAGNWEDCRALLSEYRPARAGARRGADAAVLARVKKKRGQAQKILDDCLRDGVFFISGAEYREDGVRISGATHALFRAEERFSENLFALKLRRKMLEFSDLERLSIQLLSEGGDAREDLASRYDHLLVDEYQDTNEVQERLFSLLSAGCFFAVGDIRQSIYRFRRADPEIFQKKQRISAHYQEKTFPAYIPLTHNFRSGRAVIDAVNGVFTRVMTPSLGDVDYKREQLTAGKGAAAGDGLEIRMIEGEETSPEIEAASVAAMIREMLDAPDWIEENGKKRRAVPADFAILLRAVKGKAAAFEEALAKEGIPVNADGGEDFFRSSEVEVLLALLTVIDNPKSSVELAAVMLSPLFGFTPDDLLRYKKSRRSGDLYSAVLAEKDARGAAFLEKLAGWRLRAASAPADELLEDLIDETDAELLLSAGPAFARRQKNIRRLIDYAGQISRKNGLTLPQFLRLTERQKQRDGGFPGGFTPSAGAVNLLSIHKSKGLEWPVVILADAGKGFNLREIRTNAILFDKALGAGFRYRAEADGPDSPAVIKDTLSYRALAESARQKSISEEMRVLYVALTRARQKIVVTAAVKDALKMFPEAGGELPDPYFLRAAGSFLAWMIHSLGVGREEAGKLLLTADSFRAGEASVRRVRQEAVAEEEKIPESAPPDPAVAEDLRERISRRYWREPLFAVPAKVSVSALSKTELPPAPVPAFLAGDGRGGAARGTAIHHFMQFADFSAASRSVAEEKARLAERGFLSPEEAGLIDDRQLERFLESALAKRILKGESLREYAFIDAADAGDIAPLPEELRGEKVMLQGIADCVILEPDGAVLLDYKSDRVENGAELAARYGGQLRLYRHAVGRRLGIPVKECYIYSFALGEAIPID